MHSYPFLTQPQPMGAELERVMQTMTFGHLAARGLLPGYDHIALGSRHANASPLTDQSISSHPVVLDLLSTQAALRAAGPTLTPLV